MSELIHADLSFQLYGIFYETQNRLGRFLNHDQYCDAIEQLLKKNDIKYLREVEVPVRFEDIEISGNKLDFDIENTIVLDVKAKKRITKADYQQMQRYLKAKNRKLGLIVNFSEPRIKPVRVINSKGAV